MLLDESIGLIQEATGTTRRKLGKAHKGFRQFMVDAGYREINDEDYKRFGGGGNR